MGQQIGFHEKVYDREEVLKILNWCVQNYRFREKAKDEYQFEDIYGAGRCTLEAMLEMTEEALLKYPHIVAPESREGRD